MDPAVVLEYHEINEYIRHEIGVYFSWFSFFLTILFGAMGWSLKAALGKEGAVKFPAMFFCMLFLFVVQLILAIFGTSSALADIELMRARAAHLLTLIPTGTVQGYTPGMPVPDAYSHSLELARMALIVNVFFWPIVGAIVYQKWRSNAVLASPLES